MRLVGGMIIVALGTALTIYAIPPFSFVALGAILVGVIAMVMGIQMIIRGIYRAP